MILKIVALIVLIPLTMWMWEKGPEWVKEMMDEINEKD